MFNDLDFKRIFPLMTFESGEEETCRKYMETRGIYLYKQVYDALAAFGYILLKPDGRKVFYLDAIDVMPEYQGNGYGTGLISFARDYAKTINCYKMYLITNRSNISACKCYEKAGLINKADDEIIYVYDFKEKK